MDQIWVVRHYARNDDDFLRGAVGWLLVLFELYHGSGRQLNSGVIAQKRGVDRLLNVLETLSEDIFSGGKISVGHTQIQALVFGGGGGEQAKATVVVLDSNIAWSTVVCDGPGEVLIITPSLLKVVGVTLHKKILNIISTNATQRPLDHVIMRRLNFRQELQRLKKKLIGDELPI